MPAKSQEGFLGVQLEFCVLLWIHWSQGKQHSDWAQATDHSLEPRGSIKFKLHILRISRRLVAPKKTGVLFPKEGSQKIPKDPIPSRDLEGRKPSAHTCPQMFLWKLEWKSWKNQVFILMNRFAIPFFLSKVLEPSCCVQCWVRSWGQGNSRMFCS